MPYYKREQDNILTAPSFVYAPDFTLLAEEHSQHTYPMGGWYWFDTTNEALAFFAANPEPVAPVFSIGGIKYPLVIDTPDASLGYADPVLETRDGRQVVVQYAIGTAEERAAETLRQWRSVTAVDAWQARYVLAGTPALTEGPLAQIPGATLLDQIDAFVAATLPRPALEKFRGAKTWRRSDPMLIDLVGVAGLDDAAIDDWFRAAALVP